MNKIIYLDAAATALKPANVISTEMDFLQNKYANAGRGMCARAMWVDEMVANARNRVAKFINAESETQVVFTSGATDGLNRIVNIITSQAGYSENSTFAVSDLEHHSARLPWQALLQRGKIQKMFVCELDENFDIKIDSVPKTDFLIITAMSNVLGRAQDVEKIISAARSKNPDVVTIVDASQYVVHHHIDVKKWDCDFMVFSGHKIGTDTGLGILYIRDTEKYSPEKFGGGMVLKVSDSETVLNKAPDKWEAGTLPLTQISGIVPAIDYLETNRPDVSLIKYAYDELSKISCIKIMTARDSAILSFTVDGIHPLDFGALLGARGICVRVGNMCASWIHKRFNVVGSIRVSVGAWNTPDDMKQFVQAVKEIIK
ncbi:MAG: aminotransferase class V-fold PLP-dependent enzyme [Alphaproteobacteria bacterium]|nr:aminotransferase class V-fold PLP-dependent enzyme [Alphaproteobacteria bacterium]